LKINDKKKPLLSISIVIYALDRAVLTNTIQSIAVAAQSLPSDLSIDQLSLIDNGDNKKEIDSIIKDFVGSSLAIEYIATERNLGYGRAHNIAITNSTSKYHLILNPDVIVSPLSLYNGLQYFEKNECAVALSPAAVDGDDNTQYLAKEYPSLFILLLRALDNKALNNRFRKLLNEYENNEIVQNNKATEVDIISGCFMLCRTRSLQEIGGFDNRYFLYFEDFALSIELQKFGKVMYLPEMRIVHFGGNSSKKGIRHIGLFILSMLKFFNRYGWKLY